MTMPRSSWPLNQTGNVTLDASGNGTVQLRPDGPQEHWSLSLASFKTAQTVITNEAQCRIYIGPQVADQYFVDGTLSGSTGDSTGKVANGYDIFRTGPLPSIWAVWSGGDPGAIATLSISGTASFGQGGDIPFGGGSGEGCANPIIGGGGALVYPSIHSPNFLTGSAGWNIGKDGSAEFNNLIARGVIEASAISGTPIGSSTITQSDMNGSTVESTIVTMDASGGLIKVYATTQTVTTKTSGSDTINIPAGVSTAKGECWGAGGGGGTAANFGAAGAGGGEYAAEGSLAVTGGGTVAYSVGAAGTGGVQGGAASTDGGNSTLTGTSVTVTGHGGKKGSQQTPGNGGSGSSNTVHFSGGKGGGVGSGNSGGGGGGSSAGPASSGNNGQLGGNFLGGAGGAAVSGGGAGGNGGNSGNNGSAGSAPGGGGGGSAAGNNGGNGAAGKVQITWQTASTLILVIGPAAGTDPVSGTAYGAPLTLFNPGAPAGVAGGVIVYATANGHLALADPDAQAGTVQMVAGMVSMNATAVPQTISSTSATPITGLTTPQLGPGKYRFAADVVFKGGSAAGTANFSVTTSAGNSSPSILGLFGTTAGAQAATLGPVDSGTLATTNMPGRISGEVTLGAAGTITLNVAEGTGGDTVIIVLAFFDVWPVN